MRGWWLDGWKLCSIYQSLSKMWWDKQVCEIFTALTIGTVIKECLLAAGGEDPLSITSNALRFSLLLSCSRQISNVCVLMLALRSSHCGVLERPPGRSSSLAYEMPHDLRKQTWFLPQHSPRFHNPCATQHWMGYLARHSFEKNVFSAYLDHIVHNRQ